MNKRFPIAAQMQPLHDALVERFPNTLSYLCVGGFDGQWLEFRYPDPPEGMEAIVDLLPRLTLYPDKRQIAADGVEVAVVRVVSSDIGMTSVTLLVYTEAADQVSVEVPMQAGIGTLEIVASRPGRIVIEQIDGNYFARAWVEAV